MSRHTLQHGGDTWTVGYDRPLRTLHAGRPRAVTSSSTQPLAPRSCSVTSRPARMTPTSCCSPSSATRRRNSRPSPT